jgi:hypothetical protein
VDRQGPALKPSIARRIASRLATGVTVFDEDPRDGGLTISQWMQLWQYTHENGVRTEWPDGGCLMDQPAIAVHMLDLVGDALTREAKGKDWPTMLSS